MEHPAWAGISGVVAVVGLILLVLTRGGGERLPISEGPPRSLLEQIEQNDLWVEPPTIFDSADDTFSFPGETAWSVAAVDAGDVVALTPEELIDEAVRYEGVPIYIVGRVQDARTVADDFGVDQELQLVDADGSIAYVASRSPSGAEGSIIFALGRVAAIGQTRIPSGATREAVYFLTVNPSSGVDFDTWDLKLVKGVHPVAPSILKAARRLSDR